MATFGERTTELLHPTISRLVGYFNVPPSGHRLYNALGLSIGLVVGRKTMNILVGEKINGEKIERQDVNFILRPLHGVLAYDHFSDKPADRWMKVLDTSVPAVIGAVGAVLGSNHHFNSKPIFDLAGSKQTIDQVASTVTKTMEAGGKINASMAEWAASSALGGSARTIAGGSAVAGSSVGPYMMGYGTLLSWLFTVKAGSTMPLFGRLTNSYKGMFLRPQLALPAIAKHLSENLSEKPEQLANMLESVLKTWFPHVAGDEHVNNLIEEIKGVRKSFLENIQEINEHGGDLNLIKEQKQEMLVQLQKLLDPTKGNWEKTVVSIGLDPRETVFGNHGFLSKISTWAGNALGFKTSARIKKVRENYIEFAQEEIKKLYTPTEGFSGSLPPFNKNPVHPQNLAHNAIAAGFLASGMGTIAAISMGKDAEVADLDPANPHARLVPHVHTKEHPHGIEVSTKTVTATAPSGEQTDDLHIPSAVTPEIKAHKVHSKRPHGVVNGKMLDTAEGVTSMFNAVNDSIFGSHRLHCAIGLYASSLVANKMMDALTGTAFDGKKVEIDQMWPAFKSIANKLPFDPHGETPQDKWVQVLRWAVPSLIGAMGVMEGSRIFFSKREKDARSAVYLDEVETKATMAQAKPYTYTTGVTAMFSGRSGLSFFTPISYATHLGTRFSMSSGRKTALPGLGKWWSNNPTLFPFGPPGMIDLLIREAVNNKSFDPELLETFAIGILKPWFENVQPKQIEDFVMQVHQVRDQYLREGGVPDDMKKMLEGELREHFKGAGLEHTLETIGLDPAQAILANNGFSGKVANAMGSGKVVKALHDEYATKYHQRHAEDQKAEPAAPEHTSPGFTKASSAIGAKTRADAVKDLASNPAPTQEDWREAALRDKFERQKKGGASRATE